MIIVTGEGPSSFSLMICCAVLPDFQVWYRAAFLFIHIVIRLGKGCKMTATWHIKPLNTPVVMRNCSHCGGRSEFVCSSKFRVNAQQKHIDVWLIYNCNKCGCSWNMTILSRVSPVDIGRELYDEFLDNSAGLATRYAFDADLLRRNGVRICCDDVTYDIEGDSISLEHLNNEDITVHIKSPYQMPLRLDKLLREKLGVSRSRLEECFRQRLITSDYFGFNPDKSRIIVKGDMTVCLTRSAASILFAPNVP
jgi:hypothetical protein